MPRRSIVIATQASLIAGAFAVALMTGGASHQRSEEPARPGDEETSTPMPAPEPEPWAFDPEPLLSGPSIAAVSSTKTLVSTELRNSMKRLDRTPEEAALDTLNLSMAERAGAEDVLARHRSALDEWMRCDFQPLERFLEAKSAGSGADADRLTAALVNDVLSAPENSLAPAAPDSPAPAARRSLREALADAVPESDRTTFLRLIHDYERAAVADEIAQARDRKQTLTPEQALTRIRNAAIGNDLRRSFERQVSGRGVEAAEVLDAVEPWHEQDSNVRKPLEQLRERSPKPNGREWYELTSKVLSSLSPEQRTSLARMLFGVSPVESSPE
ncbi:MAG: hypothetical protein K2Y21_11355 [Phycisphaerales bacterium]|nr:hypothetical protein [Phycisphaerales bacterium]